MTEEKEYKGQWKLPNTETWFAGTLKFAPGTGANLEIYGTFSKHFLDRKPQKVILGKTGDGEITLIDCMYGPSIHTFATEVTIAQYRPTYIIIGHHFSNEQEMLFRSVSFRLFNLFEWLAVNGTKFQSNNPDGYKIEYSKPPPIPFEFFESCAGEISFSNSTTLIDVNNRIEIEENATITLNFATKRSLQDILMDIYIFSGFITLSTFEQSYATLITFKDEDFKDDNKPKVITCLYDNPSYDAKYKKRIKGQHLIHFADIHDRFPQVIRNWHQQYHDIKPAISLLLYAFKDKLKFSEDKFMDIVRGLETFHRQTFNNSTMPESEFKNTIQEIIDCAKQQLRQWVADRLKFANEPSLRRRLKELLNTHSNPFLEKRLTNVNSFCNKVVNSRNYYTHYSPDLEHAALKGKELFGLNQLLLALLISCVLKRLGVNDDLVAGGLTRTLH